MIDRKPSIEEVGAALDGWFREILDLCDGSVFAVGRDAEHRAAAVLMALTRNVRALGERPVDETGSLYQPLVLVLAAAARRLGAVPDAGHWGTALESVRELEVRLDRARASELGLELGSPAAVLKSQMDEALVGAGVTPTPTVLDEENRRAALGLALNLGTRLLVAYALEAKARARQGRKDLSWVASLVKRAIQPAPRRREAGVGL
ncbi:MAG: hypothetical protein HYV63_25335 [Candidatus Schekmanbacteria bacterium]|nr:hypothetical protein [Candidatus Schekmanbacteria bacterium]